MDPLTTTASTLLPLTALITLGYLGLCLVSPFTTCRHCRGYGRWRARLLRGIRLCHRCDGTGLRLRPGRRAINTIRRLTR